jgi:hypothetical protein
MHVKPPSRSTSLLIEMAGSVAVCVLAVITDALVAARRRRVVITQSEHSPH